MPIIGLGTDIAEISRFEACSERFAQRVLAASEYQIFQQHKQAARYLAKRFAAKEAASKALGTGIAQGVTFKDFIIDNLDTGQPTLALSGKAAEFFQLKGGKHSHISISDEKHYTVVTVLFES